MRKAFTMIELIFVIVVIGILTAIAAPKFMGTRDDAKVASILASVKTTISDIKSAYAKSPKLVRNRQDWYGGYFNKNNYNGGCLSVFTYAIQGQLYIYVAKSKANIKNMKRKANSCDLNAVNEAALYKKATKELGIIWGRRVYLDGTYNNMSANYFYEEQLSGLTI